MSLLHYWKMQIFYLACDRKSINAPGDNACVTTYDRKRLTTFNLRFHIIRYLISFMSPDRFFIACTLPDWNRPSHQAATRWCACVYARVCTRGTKGRTLARNGVSKYSGSPRSISNNLHLGWSAINRSGVLSRAIPHLLTLYSAGV